MESLFRTRGTGISSDIESTIVPQLLAEIDRAKELREQRAGVAARFLGVGEARARGELGELGGRQLGEAEAEARLVDWWQNREGGT